MFENKGKKGIFRPEKEEVTEKFRKLHKEELHSFYVC
jgi:hypothetical protein